MSLSQDLQKMETWWCAKQPFSGACDRVRIHALPSKDRKEAMEKFTRSREAFKDKDKIDVEAMHTSWCELKPNHPMCAAWTKVSTKNEDEERSNLSRKVRDREARKAREQHHREHKKAEWAKKAQKREQQQAKEL
jgi:hypothetical protein